MLSQLTQIKSDPLDVLLFAVGLRLTQLAKMGDDKFKGLLENRNFTIQLGSDAEQTSRYYEINNGTFSQHAGPAKEPTLTITFKDSMTGVKLLTKGEATAFMTGIQNGDLKMSGDYSLLMWFNQVAKFIVPKVPEPLKPVVEQAKPLIEKATPFAKELCSKALAMIGGASAGKASGSSKYFNEANTKDVNADSDSEATSKLETLKAKAAEIKDDAMEKLDELKNEAKEKIDALKEDASEKLDEAKAAKDHKLADVKTKLEDVKDQASEKLADVKSLAGEKLDDAKSKVDALKTQADDKLDALNDEAKEKVSEAKDKVEQAKQTLTDETTSDSDASDNKAIEEKYEAAKDTTNTQDSTADDDSIRPDNVFAKSADNDNLTPALRKSAEIEAKHASDEVIADNVKTSAVSDDKSPITNISITRGDSAKDK
ncbi:hypothetical protein KZX29_10965 [Moraxella osloensis]|uniref:hypothetical protein n=1 Tax=Faucicola osloensis TaxID=34062 RepID=UPI0020054284|nr:hypothetical protein [Moraxella osloensis]MCK6159300.1 hypothetical protein [Moraxella osloensis]